MQLIQKITMDFAENGIPPKIVGKQDDSGASRAVVIALYNAGVAFEVPSGAAFMLRYKTPSGAYGLYDTMPDGSAAMAAEENRVTVQLVDQIFAAPGRVSCELRIIADGAGVSTWKWYVDVEGANAADATIPSDYINVFSNIAAEVAANAERAEQAAAVIIPEALLYKADYDPTGEVANAGGIPEYVKSNSQAEPELFMTTLTYVNGAYQTDRTYAEILDAYNAGKICMAKYTTSLFALRLASSDYILFATAPSDIGRTYTIKITSTNVTSFANASYLKIADLSSSTTSTSTTTPANSNAVKSAYDKANSAYTLASGKPSVTTGSVALSKYASYPEPTASGEWVRIGNVVQVDLYINPGSIKGLGFTNLIFNISGLPAQKYGNGVNFLTHVGISICACQIDLNAGVMNMKNIEASEISGTFDVKFSYIAA